MDGRSFFARPLGGGRKPDRNPVAPRGGKPATPGAGPEAFRLLIFSLAAPALAAAGQGGCRLRYFIMPFSSSIAAVTRAFSTPMASVLDFWIRSPISRMLTAAFS